MRSLAALTLAAAVAGCAAPLPPVSTHHITLSCPNPFELDGLWWQFDRNAEWPPPLPDARGMDPYPVPGVVEIRIDGSAIFRADVNGAELRLVPGGEAGDSACF